MTDWWQGFLWGLALAWLLSSSVTAFVLMLLGRTRERPGASPAGAAWRVRRTGPRKAAEAVQHSAAPAEQPVTAAAAARAEGNPQSPFKVSPLTR
jgi:hypothetical protein